MGKKIKLIVISGGSGVGKTTAFNELIRRKEAGELEFDVPLKVTTRPSRPSDHPLEIKSISETEYEKLQSEKHFLIQFERHGYKYGVMKADALSSATQLQIIPAREVIPLKGITNQEVDYTIVILNADPQVINERRQSRGDKLSKSEAASRAKTANNKPLDQADFVIDANQSKEVVADELSEIVRGQSKVLANILRDDLENEIEVAAKVCHIAHTAGIDNFLFGGLAANIYGSVRDITDLDILVNASNFDWLVNEYSHPELVVTEKKAHIGRVEISKTPSRVGDRSLGQVWNFDREALDKIQIVKINGHHFRIISPEDIIVMKAGLGRTESEGKFDLFDIKNIVNSQGLDSIDLKYVISKAIKCKAYDRVIKSLNSIGISELPEVAV